LARGNKFSAYGRRATAEAALVDVGTNHRNHSYENIVSFSDGVIAFITIMVLN
jgi:hypothetical protein